MNSIKILVNSIENLYPVTASGASENNGSESDKEPSVSPEEPEMPVPDPKSAVEYDDSAIRTSIDNDNTAYEEKPPIDDISDDPELLNASTWISLILFLPNYLIFKPLTFIWLITTYPFTLFFGTAPVTEPDTEKKPKDEKHPAPDDISEKTELLKQENIMSNTIKSPTSSSKYIIPPPMRLYPLLRNPGKKRKRKTLVLDLDETLIHSLSRGSPRSFNANGGSSHMIEIKLNNVASLYYAHKRPYCDFFLKEVSKWFELQIFTASVKEYADPIIDWLESDILSSHPKKKTPSGPHDATARPPKVFTKRYYRNHCTYRTGVGYIKDLSKFFPTKDDLKNVIILDNSPISYAMHEDNAVMIEGWINDQSDRDLLNLLPMLYSLSLCIDVRFILGLRSGERVFEQ